MWLKTLFLVITFVAVSTIEISEGEIDTEWLDFKKTHHKNYEGLDEENYRKFVFFSNYHKVAEHNALYKRGIKSYFLKINKHSDWTPAEFKKLRGYRKLKDENIVTKKVHFQPNPDRPSPDFLDWRSFGAVTGVKMQEDCGSCWAFSVTGAIEGQYFMKTRTIVELSEQNLIDCTTYNGNWGCEGGDIISTMIYVNQNDGIASEKTYPYEAADRTCRYRSKFNVTSIQGYGSISAGREDHLQAAVASIGPISVAIDASSENFSHYGGGVYYEDSCSTHDLDHAVLIVGYGNENGWDHWLVKNSWGTTWGEEGYIKMARNKHNNCGIATSPYYPLMY